MTIRAYEIEYLTSNNEVKTIVHFTMNNEEWYEVANSTEGSVIRVREQISYDKYTGMKYKELFREECYDKYVKVA